jgi:hypothetical protein
LIRLDLVDAGIPYFDADSRRRDFHALRGAYITALVRSGANAKEVQELARHSTVQPTLGGYAYAALYDRAAASDAFPPLLPSSDPRAGAPALAATGTTNGRAAVDPSHSQAAKNLSPKLSRNRLQRAFFRDEPRRK